MNEDGFKKMLQADPKMVPVDIAALRAAEHSVLDEKIGTIAEVPRELVSDLHTAIDSIYNAVEVVFKDVPPGTTTVEWLQEQAADGVRSMMGWLLGHRLKLLDEQTQKLILAQMMGKILSQALISAAKQANETQEGGVEVPNYDKSLN